MSGWRNAAGVGLLLLAVGGLAAPAAAALTSHSCCAEMPSAAGSQDEGPAGCQWMTPTSCCDAAALTGGAAVFAAMPPAACFQTARLPVPQRHWIRPPAAAPTSQAGALATIVLRL
jgi:hypothetical protein